MKNLDIHPAPHCPVDSVISSAPSLARGAEVRHVFYFTLWLNLLAAAAKGIYSYLSGSVSLGADSFHSLLDGSANLLALIGMHVASAPANARHPYGRRKVEILAALAIGTLIVAGLFEIAQTAVAALRGHRPAPVIGWPGFAVVGGCMAVNLFVARYESRKGRELTSPLLSADAAHTKSDLYASAAVAASFVASRYGVTWADGVCGLIVVAMVGHVAWEIFTGNIPTLLDAAVLDPSQITAIAIEVPGVKGVHKVRSRGTRWAMEIDLHVQVDADLKIGEAHQIAHLVEDALRIKHPLLSDVVVHVEPASPLYFSGTKSLS